MRLIREKEVLKKFKNILKVLLWLPINKESACIQFLRTFNWNENLPWSYSIQRKEKILYHRRQPYEENMQGSI